MSESLQIQSDDLSYIDDEEIIDDTLPQRRIRHITSIQVRNLTPFPARDALASALTQPSEQPQFTTHGRLSDDLDATLSRKRSRRISVNSMNTLRTLRSEEEQGDNVQAVESRGKRRTASRVSFSGGGSIGPNSTPARPQPVTASPTIRPGNRPRTNSIASSVSGNLNSSTLAFSGQSASSASVSLSSMLPDNTQSGLEKVINSRLVETFVAVTVSSPSPEVVPLLPTKTTSPPTRPSTAPHNSPAGKDKVPLLHSKISSSASRPASKTTSSPSFKLVPPSQRESPSSSRLSPAKSVLHSKSPSTSLSPRSNGRSSASTTTASKQKPLLSSARSMPTSPAPDGRLSIPNFLSRIHPPSTNPSFAIDTRSGHEFADWTDLSSEKLKITVWGKIGGSWPIDGTVKGKGKEKERGDTNDEGNAWKVLEEWNVDLADLVPMPEDLSSCASHLPSNTLVIVLSPSGQAYYLPHQHQSATRPSSVSPGYNSDPEANVKEVRHIGEIFPVSPLGGIGKTRKRRGGDVAEGSMRDSQKTASWQDLFKLVTLRTCLIDTEKSLTEVVTEIDNVLQRDLTSAFKREVAEREGWMDELKRQSAGVQARSDELRSRIESRRAQLRKRRETLLLAKEQLQRETTVVVEQEDVLFNHRNNLTALRERFVSPRTTLLTTLSAIFPIDPLSPPDLLFTILCVPLPVPLSSTDPAPPLSLPAHKEVTEDAVATALGYAAQVVQLLAAYLGKGLVYPVTCIGSRSLIKDGISAMVGPRMFPLYAKGVDTYRFEYGVFLLNKDIELLMADRDLRALDMRHTLPNLKNLLLTLTDGEGAWLAMPRSLNSPISSNAGLESPREETPSLELTTPPSVQNDLPEGNTPPASGSTTPTTSTNDSNSRKSFLGFSPLAGFLRSHYSSVATTVKQGAENGDTSSHPQSSDTAAEDGEDEEDRQTIRGVVMSADGEEEAKIVNGHGNICADERVQQEKLADGDVLVPTIVNHVG